MKKILIIILAVWFSFTLLVAKAEAPQLSREQRYDIALNQWIERLAWDESHNTESKIILDVNNKYSYSCLQFQLGTFQEQSKLHGVTGEIGSCATQKILAKKMINAKYENWRRWFNSVKHKTAGYPPKLEDMEM